MDKLLISKDTQAITNCMEFTEGLLPLVQGVYDSFKKIGITVTPAQILDLESRIKVETETERVRNEYGQIDSSIPPVTTQKCDFSMLVRKMLVDNMNGDDMKISGLKLSREKVEEMIELPDLTELQNSFLEYHNYLDSAERTYHCKFQYDINRLSLLSISNDKFSIRTDADKVIAERFSTYVETPKQIEVAKKVMEFRDNLNSFCQYMKSKSYLSDSNSFENEWKIPGLKYRNYQYEIDVRFISEL